jgi:type II secretion system protein G
MKKAFTLVELLIVVAILGILAAVVVPNIQNHVQHAKESAAKTNLFQLREAIGRYAAEHNDVPPGYPDNNAIGTPSSSRLYRQLTNNSKYLSGIPENPFNKKTSISIISNSDNFPISPDNTTGWIYQPSQRIIKINTTGVDLSGCAYYDY